VDAEAFVESFEGTFNDERVPPRRPHWRIGVAISCPPFKYFPPPAANLPPSPLLDDDDTRPSRHGVSRLVVARLCATTEEERSLRSNRATMSINVASRKDRERKIAPSKGRDSTSRATLVRSFGL